MPTKEEFKEKYKESLHFKHNASFIDVKTYDGAYFGFSIRSNWIYEEDYKDAASFLRMLADDIDPDK